MEGKKKYPHKSPLWANRQTAFLMMENRSPQKRKSFSVKRFSILRRFFQHIYDAVFQCNRKSTKETEEHYQKYSPVHG